MTRKSYEKACLHGQGKRPDSRKRKRLTCQTAVMEPVSCLSVNAKEKFKAAPNAAFIPVSRVSFLPLSFFFRRMYHLPDQRNDRKKAWRPWNAAVLEQCAMAQPPQSQARPPPLPPLTLQAPVLYGKPCLLQNRSGWAMQCSIFHAQDDMRPNVALNCSPLVFHNNPAIMDSYDQAVLLINAMTYHETHGGSGSSAGGGGVPHWFVHTNQIQRKPVVLRKPTTNELRYKSGRETSAINKRNSDSASSCGRTTPSLTTADDSGEDEHMLSPSFMGAPLSEWEAFFNQHDTKKSNNKRKTPRSLLEEEETPTGELIPIVQEVVPVPPESMKPILDQIAKLSPPKTPKKNKRNHRGRLWEPALELKGWYDTQVNPFVRSYSLQHLLSLELNQEESRNHLLGIMAAQKIQRSG